MTNTQRLKSLCDEANVLISENNDRNTTAFNSWHYKAERALGSIFGKESEEVKRFKNLLFKTVRLSGPRDYYADCFKCREDLFQAVKDFEMYIDEFKEEDEDRSQIKGENMEKNTDIFIVHGHDEAMLMRVARLIEKQGLRPIILSEQANGGKTIIEKIEENGDVNSAICIFSNDDIGKEKTEEEYNPRARQNVIFEAGYFMGRLGRENVIILSENDIEIPSDLQGIVYLRDDWATNLLRELDKFGYTIDYSKTF